MDPFREWNDEELQEEYFGKKVEITYVTQRKTFHHDGTEDEKLCESFNILE